jgi:hypothetical protein
MRVVDHRDDHHRSRMAHDHSREPLMVVSLDDHLVDGEEARLCDRVRPDDAEAGHGNAFDDA